MQPLHVSRVRQMLGACTIGRRIEYHVRLPSTMLTAHQIAREAATPADCSGTMVVAEEQTAGRGRRGRRWEAPPGRALLTSTILAAPHLPIEPAQIPMIAGLAVLEALRAVVPVLARHLWLKWPNDLLILGDGAVGKVAGLLVESQFAEHSLQHAVVGIGINVNQRRGELPPPRADGIRPVSLYLLLEREVAREEVLAALCWALHRNFDRAAPPSPEQIHQRWQASLLNLGHPVIVHTGDRVLRGRAVATTREGALIVARADGKRAIIQAGDADFHWQSQGE